MSRPVWPRACRRRRAGGSGQASCQPMASRRNRSVSVKPPQTPYGSRAAKRLRRHIPDGPDTIGTTPWRPFPGAMRAEPRSPSGWKNCALSRPRHRPSSCQSQMSAQGPGNLRTLLIDEPSVACRVDLWFAWKYPVFPGLCTPRLARWTRTCCALFRATSVESGRTTAPLSCSARFRNHQA